ncbi:DNA polymerase III subunit alpha [Oceanobacillus chungangensis]|uniref:DNA polymerase III subunit alpha n=1 Tax=Oceanobacillus chungangensis TaxID=1229152 RepID=A0A3D8Q2B8_9BACI|nr:DNA polymerase III subunit alpha [Oceanobacillus chungangensis]RDW21579.1 DNA polymerase III subunit alpha [Oceanobacillus chungangensis]
MSYTHLRVRSGYSLMDSTITIEKLVNRAKELQFNAIALTDENVLYGTIPFYKACMKAGIKPIIGMVTKVMIGDEENEIVLLAKNNQGYEALVKLSTDLQLGQLHAIDFLDLHTYTDHLICILPVAANQTLEGLLLDHPFEQAAAYVGRWQEATSNGDFYLGVQANGDIELIRSLKAFYEQFEISVVAINDVRYLDEKDAIAYDCLQAMKHGNRWAMQVSDPRNRQKHLRSTDEMEASFGDLWQEVLLETEKITSRCQVTFDFDQRLLPSFPVPDGLTANDYLEQLCNEMVGKKYETVTAEVSERLAYELGIIKSMNFSDYFLIVADFIHYAKENQILVGPGRGSSAGSLVAYVLGITDIDPIHYQLLFERFLNPERQTMPDIDIDFADEKRDMVIDYVREKYGVEHVAQIITFGTFATRSLIRELIKTIEVDDQEARFILNELPSQTDKKLTEIIKDSADLREFIKASPKLKVLFTVAIKLEGIPRHISTHAAGVVISENPLSEHVPLTIGSNETRLTQYTMTDLESLGLLKIDFLGLRNLTLLEKIIKSIQHTANKSLTLHSIPLDDEATYALLRKGQTNGVFQLESQGMKGVLKTLRPTSYEDIVAVNALYRPGPMDFIPTYIARKHRKEQVIYPHPDLAPILEKTYGVLVYQEQIMQIANRIAGFTLGEADILRRAVSKKKQDVMAEQKEAFVNGCLQNGYTLHVAEEIFSWIVKFANYGFPRSHAAAYSKISYQLSYLKANYPANFFAELLSTARNQQDKLSMYFKEMKEQELALLPPSINHSYGKYTVERQQVRMGLASIKGVSSQTIKEIIHVRKQGKFKNLFDFCLRIDFKLVNRQTIENLIIAGAFDETYANRAGLLASLDQAMEQGELFREFSDQPSLFKNQIELEVNYVEIEDFSIFKKLADEKEFLGMYISSHPLKEYRSRLRASGFVTLTDAETLVGKKNIKATAIIQQIKPIRTKRGESMAFITVGDETSEMDAVVFPDLHRETRKFLEEESLITIKGKIESRNNRVQWILDEIKPFAAEELLEQSSQRLFIKMKSANTEESLAIIKKVAHQFPGSVAIIIYQEETKQTYQLAEDYYINPTRDALDSLRNYFGKADVVLQK